jgi:hypothetical protein
MERPTDRRWRRLCAVSAVVLWAGQAIGSQLVYPNPESVQPLAVGSQVPKAMVATVAGDPVDLAEMVREQGVLLVFYRGGW